VYNLSDEGMHVAASGINDFMADDANGKICIGYDPNRKKITHNFVTSLQLTQGYVQYYNTGEQIATRSGIDVKNIIFHNN
jgi:hypothetical protein